jgi:D-sorbitol dehydrogenase (acceptor)
MKDIRGKQVLITGAARGIGYAFARAFVDEGASVMIADRDIERAETAGQSLGENCSAVLMEVSDQLSIEQAVQTTIDQFGRIDVLINNAAIFTAAPIVEIERADFERCFSINVAGTLFTLQAVAKHMIERGGGGKIINIASQAGRRGESLVGVYCASKAAVISLTQSAGLNLISHGINVNAIAPGVVDGEHWDGVDAFFARYEGKKLGQKKKEVGEAVPFGRMGTAEDLIGMALFLASNASDYVVAQTYNVDGGNWMS